MKVDVTSNGDGFFEIPEGKIEVKQLGEAHVASDGERVAIEKNEEDAVKAVEEMQQIANQAHAGKKPVPIQNAKGLGWFDGTSWGSK